VRCALVALLLALVVACGDDGETVEPPRAGLIVGQLVDEEELTDTLLLVDPERPTQETLELDDLGPGVPAGPHRALYQAGEGTVLVDAEAARVHDLEVEGVAPRYSHGTVTGGGERFTVLLSPTAEVAAVVDLEEGTAEALALEGVDAYLNAELTPDEQTALVNTDEGPWLVPTDDPAAAEPVGGGAGQLADDGSAVLVTGEGPPVIRPLDGEGEIAVTEEPVDGALLVGERVVLVQGEEAVLVEPGAPDVLASAPFRTDGPAPVLVGDAVLLPSGGSWTLLDSREATATELPDVEGLVPSFGGPPPSRWVPFSGDGLLRAVDTEDGSVVDVLDGERIVGFPLVAAAGPAALVSADRAEATVLLLADLDTGEVAELATRVQGAALSPDGEQVAWAEGELPELRIAPVADPAASQVAAEGVALPLWLDR
jgi:hypothetical protein